MRALRRRSSICPFGVPPQKIVVSSVKNGYGS
jgi:hypothetical protein